jgi:hypothetical protein
MAIETTYRELVLENIIKSLLEDGISPSVTKITNEFNDFVSAYDVSAPLFSKETYKVTENSTSSSELFRSTSDAILQDMKVIYKHLLKTSDQIIINFDRWRDEAQLLEQRLNDLQNRVETILLISEDTAGYLNYIQDNFVDTSKVDMSVTSAYINPAGQYATIATSSVGSTKLDLSGLLEDSLEFVVLSKTGLVSQVAAERSNKINILRDQNIFWQEKIYTNRPLPVSVELKINFKEQKTFSRIDLDLHMAVGSASIQCTPMYSDDGYNWQQFPTDNFTLSVVDRARFQFSSVTTQYFKLIMTKLSFDVISNELYVYEFGLDEIAFFNEGFTTGTEHTLISQPLSVNNVTTNTPQEFNKVVLDTCEFIPAETFIDYYVVASNTSTVPYTSSSWIALSPSTRDNPIYPTSLDLGSLSQIEISGVGISYDLTENTNALINPDKDFTLVTGTSGTTPTTAAVVSSAKRYDFLNSNDRILNYELSTDVVYADKTLEIWRNVRDTSSSSLVREYLNGWGFEEPHYSTTVKVDNANGITMDFGSKTIIIDGTVQSGKVNITYGNHSILVHKDNWKYIDPTSVTDLATLKTADSLYPYNHRYLVEGFVYPAGYPTNEEEIYKGFDIVAEFLMKEASIFDITYNIKKDDYARYSLDLDAEDTGATVGGSATTREPSRVFVVKVDEEHSDFTNEKFLIRFKSVDTLYKYLRLKTVFRTEDSSITPYLDSYRIKISS